MHTEHPHSFQHGAIDRSFAENGVYIFGDSFINDVYGVTALSNNQLLISGTYFPGGYALVKMNEVGTLDNEFGIENTGVAHRYFVQQHTSHGVSSTRLADGKIVFAGVYRVVPDEFSAAITQLDSVGNVDTAFGVDGVTTINAPAPAPSASNAPKGGDPDPWAVRTSCTLTQLNDKSIVFSKSFTNMYRPRESYSIVGKLTEKGTLDETFHAQGYTYIRPELPNIADSHLIQADGKIVVAGHLTGQPTAYLARFNKNGSLDSGFGVDGYINYPDSLGSTGFVTALLAHSKDKCLLITNYAVDPPQNNGLIRSLNADGSPDLTFNQGTPVPALLPGANTTIEWRNAVEDNDGFVVLGYSDRLILARYLKDGQLDEYFGENGGWTSMSDMSRVENLARQSDGKIVVVGVNARGESVVVRFLGSRRSDQPDETHHTPSNGVTVFSIFRRYFERLKACRGR